MNDARLTKIAGTDGFVENRAGITIRLSLVAASACTLDSTLGPLTQSANPNVTWGGKRFEHELNFEPGDDPRKFPTLYTVQRLKTNSINVQEIRRQLPLWL